MKKTITLEIGDKVLCCHESNYTGEQLLGEVEYFKDGWVGVRSIDRTGFRTSTLVPQQPGNLRVIEL